MRITTALTTTMALAVVVQGVLRCDDDKSIAEWDSTPTSDS